MSVEQLVSFEECLMMNPSSFSLQPSEGIVVGAAATLYAAYISSGRVPDGREKEWRERAAKEAILLARYVDDSVRSDAELS